MQHIHAQRSALIAAALSLAACGGGDSLSGGRPQADATLPAVEAVEVVVGSLPLEERLSGSVRARNQTQIYPEVAGTIEQVYVDDGDHVAAGDRLVQLRSREFEERVRQAEAGLRVAEARVRQAEAARQRAQADLARTQKVFDSQLGTQAELDAAVANATSADADLDLMDAQQSQASSVLEERQAELADTLVRAPIDGIVGARNAEVGQQANSNTPLFVIGDVSEMQVDVTLTQAMLGYIEVGTPVSIFTDAAPDDAIDAKISRISPYLHEVTRTTRAEIDIDAGGRTLRPGMFVTVDARYGESEQAPLVPNSAIFHHPRDGREGVFVADLRAALANPEVTTGAAPELDEVPMSQPVGPVEVRFTPIQVVARGRNSSGIQGVEPGDWVVTLGHNLLDSADDQQAVVQPTPWEHILELQSRDSQDLLDIISEKQQATTGSDY